VNFRILGAPEPCRRGGARPPPPKTALRRALAPQQWTARQPRGAQKLQQTGGNKNDRRPSGGKRRRFDFGRRRTKFKNSLRRDGFLLRKKRIPNRRPATHRHLRPDRNQRQKSEVGKSLNAKRENSQTKTHRRKAVLITGTGSPRSPKRTRPGVAGHDNTPGFGRIEVKFVQKVQEKRKSICCRAGGLSCNFKTCRGRRK